MTFKFWIILLMIMTLIVIMAFLFGKHCIEKGYEESIFGDDFLEFNCEKKLYDDEGFYHFVYSDYFKLTFEEVLYGN